jgi:hypothetical protein
MTGKLPIHSFAAPLSKLVLSGMVGQNILYWILSKVILGKTFGFGEQAVLQREIWKMAG